MLAPPIFPGRRQPSIVGRNELNYRVRNGNGWTLVLISTNLLVAKSAWLRFHLRRKLHSLAPRFPRQTLRWFPSESRRRSFRTCAVCQLGKTQTTNYYMTLLFNCQVLSSWRKFGDPYRIRTDVNGVRGRCLNHLTNGPFIVKRGRLWGSLNQVHPLPDTPSSELVHLHGLEPGTH